MFKYRVSVDDVEAAKSSKGDIGFANMDIRFLEPISKIVDHAQEQGTGRR